MKLTIIGSNQTQLTFNNGSQVLFSYETPVAAYIPDAGYIVTNKYYSETTSKHINKWLGENRADHVDQSMLNNLCNCA